MDKEKQSIRRDKKTLAIAVGILIFVGLAGIFTGGIFMGRYLAGKESGGKEDISLYEKEAEDEDAVKTGGEEEKPEFAMDLVENEDSEGTGIFEDIIEPENDTPEAESTEDYDDERLQVVILGDSIYDHVRDETGIAYLIGQQLDANVYNLGIGGVAATTEPGENNGDKNWTSTSGVGIAKVLNGTVPVEAIRDCTAKDIISENKDKFKNTDIFIVEYGINDFLSNRQLDNAAYNTDYSVFDLAMGAIVDNLREVSPNAAIVLCEPHFCEFYGAGGAYIGSSNMVANWYGTLFDYVGKVDYTAGANETWLFAAYERSGINTYTAGEYLLDGIHMNEEGRRKYAEELCGYIKRNILKTEPPLDI